MQMYPKPLQKTNQPTSQPNRGVSLLTLNIWFGEYQTRERMVAIGRAVDSIKPGIIAFQEVTFRNLALLKTQDWFKRYTLLLDENSTKLDPYFVVLLTKFKVLNWRNIPFATSRMGRSLLLAQLQINTIDENVQVSIPFTIATSHLESMDYSSKEREKQLAFSLKMLAGFADVCLMGDLNLEPKVDGDILLPLPWFDAWLAILNHTESNGYTWNVGANPYAKISEPDVAENRFDRIICKLSNFAVKSVDILESDNSGAYFSDHFALHAELGVGILSDSRQYNRNASNKLEFRRKIT
ncbi:uncharacterized protein LOC5504860 [Nematostella vectensis]|uniref:uncharacterized protein LOC5504860 n=1 Tax=Nematostella vectensis TaxID=45351 RepID=UPI001390151A|nr:uncharacterized protein LOC5504860 [Nematostella vectensis]